MTVAAVREAIDACRNISLEYNRQERLREETVERAARAAQATGVAAGSVREYINVLGITVVGDRSKTTFLRGTGDPENDAIVKAAVDLSKSATQALLTAQKAGGADTPGQVLFGYRGIWTVPKITPVTVAGITLSARIDEIDLTKERGWGQGTADYRYDKIITASGNVTGTVLPLVNAESWLF